MAKLWAMTRRAKQSDGGFSDLLSACHQLVSERGQASLYVLANAVVQAWRGLNKTRREAFFAALATEFAPDAGAVSAAAQAYIAQPQADQLARLVAVAEAPRQELFRRINRVKGGTATLLDMRVALLECMRTHAGLEAVDRDFLHLLSSWFNPGFLRFEAVSWDSPAALLEKIIHHEAVHAIDSWAHLRRRLEADRRCFAFMHPQLPGEPLIFVEVALVDDMPSSVAPLIATRTSSEAIVLGRPSVAVFYSISNCQPGLRGVSLGNFLIKRVAQHLAQEVTSVKTFCTLSPVPGLVRWLDALEVASLPAAVARAHERVSAWRALQQQPPNAAALEQAPESLRAALKTVCAHYLVHGSHARGADPVARFHLDNGARLERINVGGDLSKNGLRQSLSVLVNYLYDLDDVETRHQAFVDCRVSHSREVGKSLRK